MLRPMLPRPLSQLVSTLAVVIASLALSSCEKVPLTAPTGSSITLTTATTAIPANGSATIIAQVMESSGTPPHSGTRVTFTTTLGSFDQIDASTDAGGRAVVTFRAGGASGIATIAAASGGASTSGGTTPGTGNGGTVGNGGTERTAAISGSPSALPRLAG
jgi:hypothetical protein